MDSKCVVVRYKVAHRIPALAFMNTEVQWKSLEYPSLACGPSEQLRISSNLRHWHGTYASSSSRVCWVSVNASTAADMYRREGDEANFLSAAIPYTRDVVAPRAAARDDDDDGGTKALTEPVIAAVDRRKRSAALVVFIAAGFLFSQKITNKFNKICK